MSAGDLHRRLRGATAGAHAALERDLGWERRVATRAGYAALLARLRGFHAAYEPAIGAALADDGFLAPRLRLARLDADLVHLGLAPEAPAALARPLPIRLDGPAAALGALYVLEGSTLGGQLIGRHVAGLHGLGIDGLRYYRAHGPETGRMWSAFRARLDGFAGEPAAEAALTAAAVATFEALRVWLCGAAEVRAA